MTVRNLFTKHDHRVMTGMTKEQAAQAAAWFWRSRQFGIGFSGPHSMSGAQYYSKLGLRQQINIWVADEGGGVGMDLNLSAELTDEGAAVGIIGAVLVLPLTVAVGAVSYIEYENDANRLIQEFWSYLHGFPGNPQPPAAPVQTPSWAQGQAAQPAGPAPSAASRSCPSCGATADPDARFCKACGNKL